MSIILFIIILAILVLSHEFGHFISAKINGVKVEEFGFGFPPRIFSFKKGETIYSLNLIPFGGFVKIYGEEGGKTDDKRSFSGQKIRVRALILAAGVLFNLILTWPLLSATYLIGAPISVEGDPATSAIAGGSLTEKGVIILQVQDDTPAYYSGLKEGDYLLRFSSGKGEILEVSEIEEIQRFIAGHAGDEIKIDYERSGKFFSTKATPIKNIESGKGVLGIAMDKVGLIRLPFHRAVIEGLKTTFRLTVLTAKSLVVFFADLFTERKMISQVAGPVGIVGLVGSASQSGFVFVLQLIALLSINLAFINLIPFPALDGGRLLFLAVEFIRRKPISQKAVNIAHNLGFAILILLMLAITYQDILKLLK